MRNKYLLYVVVVAAAVFSLFWLKQLLVNSSVNYLLYMWNSYVKLVSLVTSTVNGSLKRTNDFG